MTETLKNDWRVWALAIGIASGTLSILPLREKLVLVSLAAAGVIFWWLLRAPERWIGAFLISALVLPPLPIELGNSGPHVCMLAALAGLMTGAAQRWEIPTGPLSRAFLCLFFVLLASTSMAAWFSGIVIAAGSLIRVLLLGISVYLFFRVRAGESRPEQDKRLLGWLFIAGMISALFACFDFYFQFPTPAGFAPQFVWLSSGIFRRAQGVFYEASTLGNVCAFFLVMIIVAFSRGRNWCPLPRFLLACGAVLFATALILSYSRASVLNVAVATAAMAFLLRGRLRWTRVAPVVGGLVFIGLLVVARFFPVLSEAYWYRASSFASLFSSPEGALSGRVANWESLLGFLQHHPAYALLGIGYKTIPYSGVIGGQVVSDNVYLGMLVEAGILGFAAVLWLNAIILRSAYRAAHSSAASTAFFGAWIFCFWAGETVQMLSGDLLTYWRVLPLYFWVLAIAVRGYNENPDRGPV